MRRALEASAKVVDVIWMRRAAREGVGLLRRTRAQ
jgi:hypothetical protein